MLFVFGDLWLVTGDWEVIHRLSFVGLQELVDMALAPYPTWRQVERMKSIKEMISFSIYQISLKMCAHDPVLMDSEAALSGLDFITPSIYKNGKMREKTNISLLEIH